VFGRMDRLPRSVCPGSEIDTFLHQPVLWPLTGYQLQKGPSLHSFSPIDGRVGQKGVGRFHRMSALEQAHFDLRLQRTENQKVDLPHGRDIVPGSISVAVILALAFPISRVLPCKRYPSRVSSDQACCVTCISNVPSRIAQTLL
jgi:hypothetical protein